MSREVIEPVSQLGHCLSAPNLKDTVADALLAEKILRYFNKVTVGDDEFSIDRCRHRSYRDNCRLLDLKEQHAAQLIFKHADIDQLPDDPLSPLPIRTTAQNFEEIQAQQAMIGKPIKPNLLDVFKIQSLKWLEESVASTVELRLNGQIEDPLTIKDLLVDLKMQIDSMFECARTILSQSAQRLNALLTAVLDQRVFDDKLESKLEDLLDFILKSFYALWGEEALAEDAKPEIERVSNLYNLVKPILSSQPIVATRQLKSCFAEHLEPLYEALTKAFSTAEGSILERHRQIADHFERAIAHTVSNAP